MKKNSIEPDFHSLVDGIVLADEKELKQSEMHDEIQTLSQICERLERGIKEYYHIEQHLDNEFDQLKSALYEMGQIRDQILKIRDEKIKTAIEVRLLNIDELLVKFGYIFRQIVISGTKECQDVVDDVVSRLKSQILGKTSDMEPIFISAKTKHWITITVAVSYLVVLLILIIVIYVKSRNS